MSRLLDLTSEKFGRLTVLERTGKDKFNNALWKCICICGKETITSSNRLRTGKTKSCGCLNHLMRRKNALKHGHTKGNKVSPEYNSWNMMKRRCYDQKNKNYHDYGGRGIRIEWDSFEQFLSDMGERPSSNHSIERIDVNDNYSKSNCIWADKTQQSRNQRVRKDNKTGVKGVGWDKQKQKFNARIGINKQNIFLGYFDTKEEATEARKQAESKYWHKSS